MLTFIQFMKEAKPENETVNLHRRLKRHYKHSLEHEKVLGDFTLQSNWLNKELHRKHNNPNYKSDHDQEQHINELDVALHQHKTPESFHVYSGVYHEAKPGIYHHPAYLHTSLKKNMAEAFAHPHHKKENNQDTFHHHILKIHIPKEHPGSYVDHIGEFRGQKEFILPRGTNLKIHPHHETETRKNKHDETEYFHTHHATIEK